MRGMARKKKEAEGGIATKEHKEHKWGVGGNEGLASDTVLTATIQCALVLCVAATIKPFTVWSHYVAQLFSDRFFYHFSWCFRHRMSGCNH